MIYKDVLAPCLNHKSTDYYNWPPDKDVWVWFLHNWGFSDESKKEPLVCDMAYVNRNDAYGHFWAMDRDNAKDGKWSELKKMKVLDYLLALQRSGGCKANPFMSLNFMEFITKWGLEHEVLFL